MTQRPSSLAADHDETMGLVAKHQDETARCGRPAVFAAEAMQVAIEEVEEVVLAIMAMLRHRQAGRIGALHHGQLTDRVVARRLDQDSGAVPVIGVAATRLYDEANHDWHATAPPPPLTRPWRSGMASTALVSSRVTRSAGRFTATLPNR